MAGDETFQVHDDRFDSGKRPFDDATPLPRKPGWTTTTKVILGILGFLGVLMLVCCGGVVWFAQRVARDVQEGLTEDPQRITDIRKEITEIDIPPEWSPRGGGDLKLLGMLKMKFTMFGDEQSGMLMLMEMNMAGISREDMAAQFKQQAGARGSQQIRIESTETKTFTINGEECDFVFAKGVREGADELPAPPENAPAQPGAEPAAPPGSVRQVSGMFPSRNGMAFLMLIVPEEKWDEAAVISMLESIHN